MIGLGKRAGVVAAVCVVAVLWGAASISGAGPKPADTPRKVPKNGFVPTKEVATEIAYAVLASKFGTKFADFAKPLRAEARSDRWVVTGKGAAKVLVMRRDGTVVTIEAKPELMFPGGRHPGE